MITVLQSFRLFTMTCIGQKGRNLIKFARIYQSFSVRALSSDNKANESTKYDIVVVGGGIVGVATARELLKRQKNLRMAVVEKEANLAKHQSGHNSGVIHAGIYYKPGTLKAKLCVEGSKLAYEYCDLKNIPYKKVGKLIVATDQKEVKLLGDLYERALKNKCPEIQMLRSIKEIRNVEPYCHGLEALWSPYTGIVDWALVTQYYSKDFQHWGGKIYYNFQVNGFKENTDPDHPVRVLAKNGTSLEAKYVLTCTGLQSDLVSQLSGCGRDPQIIPFRGEYLLLNPGKCHIVRGNIYPVPDPRFPFLGVHFTPRMDGSVWLGPNALLAFKKEGYSWFDINPKELMTTLAYPGFQKLALKHIKYGIVESLKSIFLNLQVKELQKYIPEVTLADVRRGPAGVRAQALDRAGNLVDDFFFDVGKGSIGARVLHCRNAPSPGATSSLAIAKMVADKMEQEFCFK